MKKQLPNHRAHHYPSLIRRWRDVARRSGLALNQFAEHDSYPLYVLQTRRPSQVAPSIYLSAGIHGDEPGGTEGVLAWAEKHPKTLRRARYTIFPCLNPWGLTHNIRTDSTGLDLNRQFHDSSLPAFRALHQIIAGQHYALALALHEDYDAQGIYLYELNTAPVPLSPLLLDAARFLLPTDPRRKIDGRQLTGPGYLHRNVTRRKLPDGPEAIFLARKKVDLCFTIETPSEFSLDRRIRAQRTIIQTAIQLVLQKEESEKSHLHIP